MPYIGNQHNVGDHVNNFKVLDDISSYTATFDGSATSVVSTSAETIRIPEHRFIQGQRVTYNNGGGSNIGGLTSGTAYYVSFDSANTIKLATSLANANSNNVINLSTVGGGTSHTLNAAFDGINTKFKLTFGSGNSARLNNATQINVAINNVIQRPNLDANNFTDGFALADNHKIVFKTAPTSQDIFWGSIIANTIENFDLRDNEVDNFTGNGSATEFNLSTIPANNESVIVTIDGVLQHPSDKNTSRAYTLLSNIIQFTAAPALNAEIQVRHIGFAGASTADVSGFYGRTGNVVLGSTDHITTGDITSRNINASGIITAASANFGGNVSIGGTLTYEDVTNIDSVGIITAKSGIHVTSGNVGIGTTVSYTTGAASNHKLTVAGDDVLGIGRANTDMFYVRREYESGKYTFQTINGGNDGNFNFQPFGGAVGIGTKTPATKLHVTTTSASAIPLTLQRTHNNNVIIEYKNSTNQMYAGLVGDALGWGVGTNGNLAATVNNKLMIRRDTGNIGVGTVIPETNLTIAVNATNQTTATIPTVRLTNLDTTAVASDIVGSYEFFSKDTHSLNKVTGFMRNTPTDAGVNYDLTFGTIKTGDSNAVERLRIKSNGQVGIGTISPSTTLHTYSEGNAHVVLHESAGGYDSRLRIKAPPDRYSQLEFADDDADAGEIRYFHTDNYMSFHVNNNVERLRIASDGNVGIGSQNPSKKLSIVSGNNLGISLINNTDFATAGIYLEGGRNAGTGIVGELQFYNRRNGGVTSNIKVNGDGNFNIQGTNTNSKVGINSISPEKQLVVRTGSGGDGGILVKPNINYAANQDRAYLIVGTDDWGTGTSWKLTGFQHRIKSNSTGTSRVTIDTSSGEAFCVENGGNVGIGTNRPVRPLHIHNADCRIRLEDAGVATDVELQNTSGDAVLTTNGASNVRLQTDNTERLRITSTGEVGINVTVPDAKLEVRDGASRGVIVRSTSTQSTDSNKAIRVRNNSDTNTFHVSHKGQGYFATRVGIGSAAPQNSLDISSSDNTLAVFRSTDSGANIDIFDDDTHSRIRSVDGRLHLFADFDNNVSSSSIKFYIDGSNEKLQINSAGRLLFGNHLNDRGGQIQYEGSEHSGVGIHRNTNSHSSPALQFSKSRGTSAGSNTIVQNNDYLGMISFKGTDGSGLANGAFITGIVDGTPGSNDMPTRLGFWTSADGSETPTERMRIDKDGNVTKPHNAMFKAKMSASRAQSSSGWVKIQFDTDSATDCFDVGNNFDTSNHRFTAPVTGYYHFGCNQRFDAGNGNYFRLVFYKNGQGGDGYVHGHSIYRDNDGFNYVSLTITGLIQLDANDYVEAYAYSHNDTAWTLQRESQFFGYLVG